MTVKNLIPMVQRRRNEYVLVVVLPSPLRHLPPNRLYFLESNLQRYLRLMETLEQPRETAAETAAETAEI
jgi:hypothetical protein